MKSLLSMKKLEIIGKVIKMNKVDNKFTMQFDVDHTLIDFCENEYMYNFSSKNFEVGKCYFIEGGIRNVIDNHINIEIYKSEEVEI